MYTYKLICREETLEAAAKALKSITDCALQDVTGSFSNPTIHKISSTVSRYFTGYQTTVIINFN
jgi:hypothetical protein